MSKKHFERIAAILRDHDDVDPQLVDDLADFFQSENPFFDRVRFIEAATA